MVGFIDVRVKVRMQKPIMTQRRIYTMIPLPCNKVNADSRKDDTIPVRSRIANKNIQWVVFGVSVTVTTTYRNEVVIKKISKILLVKNDLDLI